MAWMSATPHRLAVGVGANLAAQAVEAHAAEVGRRVVVCCRSDAAARRLPRHDAAKIARHSCGVV
jgi:hypothetical protein